MKVSRNLEFSGDVRIRIITSKAIRDTCKDSGESAIRVIDTLEGKLHLKRVEKNAEGKVCKC